MINHTYTCVNCKRIYRIHGYIEVRRTYHVTIHTRHTSNDIANYKHYDYDLYI